MVDIKIICIVRLMRVYIENKRENYIFVIIKVLLNISIDMQLVKVYVFY